MAKFKEVCGNIWKWVWECLKRSLLPLIMYISASVVICMFTLDQAEIKAGLTTGRFWTIFGIALFAVVYGALMAYVDGGTGYDMLVAGNMKRMLSDNELKMSSHKEQKEYRTWKGFAVGGVIALINLVVALIWGANQAAINHALTLEPTEVDAGLRAMVLVNMFTWGWSMLPFMFANAGGIYVSYYWAALLGVLPIVTSGILYIVGAYARRNKKLAQQAAEKQAEEEEANRPQKVNYGGLPGTKPNKKK